VPLDPACERALLPQARQFQRAIQAFQALGEPRVTLGAVRLREHLARTTLEPLDERCEVPDPADHIRTPLAPRALGFDGVRDPPVAVNPRLQHALARGQMLIHVGERQPIVVEIIQTRIRQRRIQPAQLRQILLSGRTVEYPAAINLPSI